MRIVKKVPAHIVESVWAEDGKFDLVNFYKDISRYVGIVTTDDTVYDCRHINISPELQEEWIVEFNRRYPSKYSSTQILMTLAVVGPKAIVDDEYRKAFGINDTNVYSEPFYVEIEDGFVS